MAKTAFAKQQLQSFIDRVERLEAERAAIGLDIKEVYAEAKAMGFDTKIMRQVVRLRKLDKADFQEQQAMLDLYLEAVGFDTTQLGRASRLEPEEPDDEPEEQPPPPALDDEALYRAACDLVILERKASTSYIQRRLQIGYNRAASLIERMEAAGVIGSPDHSGKRPVLVDIQTGEITEQNPQSPSNRDVSADGKASSEAGPQAEASLAGTGAEMLAGHEGRSEGEGEPISPSPLRGDGLMDLPAFLDRRTHAPPAPA